MEPALKDAGTAPEDTGYVLNDQIGFILRVASQRHAAIFTSRMPDGLTPTRFAALAKLHETGPLPQNELGRRTAMDVATIKGVVDRLRERGLVRTEPDPGDGRRIIVALTDKGVETVRSAVRTGFEITEETLAPLSEPERATLIRLLRKIC